MPTQVTAVWDRLRRSAREFSVAQRTLALLGLAVVVLGLVAVSSLLNRQTMSPLFAGVSTADASAIVDVLQDEGVPYELAGGGSTVLVPEDQLYPMRLTLAAAGLPSATDGGGYSLLDDMGMTSSDFQQQITYQRALEGELAKTISAIDGVEAASVKLALPEKSVFVSKTLDPTASVFVQTRPGVDLDNRQVQAVVHLVSAGIEGMKPTDVAVIDAAGRVLSAVGTGPGGTGDQQSSEYETKVTASIQAMLDRVVGPGKSVVAVSAELNQDSTQRTSESFSAEEGVPPLSSTRSTEDYTGGSGAGTAAGVLGPDNIQVPAGGAADNGTYSKESETLNNAVDKVTEATTIPAGQLRRQSVSVAVDATAGAGIDIPQLTSMVSAAAGIDPVRGDTVAVERVTFDTAGAEAAQTALAAASEQDAADRTAGLMRTGIIAAVIVLLVVLTLVSANRRAARARRQALDLGELEIINRSGEVAEIEGGPAERPALGARISSPAAPTLLDTVQARRAEVSALAAEQPGEVADLLRGWLVGKPR